MSKPSRSSIERRLRRRPRARAPRAIASGLRTAALAERQRDRRAHRVVGVQAHVDQDVASALARPMAASFEQAVADERARSW